ncbi:MAG: replication-associated recombination protein A [Paracoccaceae bacterium]
MSDLFDFKEKKDNNNSLKPLSDKLRPDSITDIFGQDHITGETGPINTIIKNNNLSSIIFWGPPGTGKTSIARIIPKVLKNSHFHEISAVSSGTSDLKEIFKLGKEVSLRGEKLILFVDEIHYFNKLQQDMFLPFIEGGSIGLIGATSQNPSFQLNAALLSRSLVYQVETLSEESLKKIIIRVEKLLKKNLLLENDGKQILIQMSGGDARVLINLIDQVFTLNRKIRSTELTEILSLNVPKHDKSGDNHYGLISAIHKSIRGSDPDAGLFWLARALNAGEDPFYIFRRLLRISIEDVGLANPDSQRQVLDSWSSYEKLGSPEGDIALAMSVIALSLSPKSNAVYLAEKESKKFAKKHNSEQPPKHILNSSTALMDTFGYGVGYKYDHDSKGGFSGQNYFPDGFKRTIFYHPVERGYERELKKRISYFSKLRNKI